MNILKYLKLITISLLINSLLFAQQQTSTLNQGIVGQRNLAPGTSAPERLDRLGSLVTQDGSPRYQESTLNGQMFVASTQAGVALSLLSATATGFILSNPAGSGRIIIPVEIIVAPTTAPAGVSTLYVAANVNTIAAATVHTTPLVVRSTLLGSSAIGVGLADSAATLPATPVVVRAIPGGPVATGSINSMNIKDEVAGSFALMPGSTISIQALTTAISAVISVTWLELIMQQ